MYINEKMTAGIRNGILTLINKTTSANRTLDVYQGTMPTDLTGFDPATHTSDLLVRFTTFSLAADNVTLKGVTFDTTPAVTTASATGTASWFALYYNTTPDVVIFGDVTNTAGNGALKLASTSITSGASIDPGSLIIKITRTPIT